MKLGTLLVAALLVPALVDPAVAAVRPSVKPIVASSAKTDRSLTLRHSTRAGVTTERENNLFMGAVSLVAIAGAVAVAAAVAAVVIADDRGASPA